MNQQLNPIFQQALAPFCRYMVPAPVAAPAPALTADQQRALQIIDSNIEMFSRYPNSAATVESLRTGREELLDFFAGNRRFTDVPFAIRDLVSAQPDWGTYGT